MKSYEIHPRPPELGGGWHLHLITDGEETGGGVFPPVEGMGNAEKSEQAAYAEALAEASEWLATRVHSRLN